MGVKNNLLSVKLKKVIIIFFVGFFIILGATKALSAISTSYDNDKSLYFVQLINYSLPVAKVTSFNSEDLSEQNKSLKEKLWGLIGVDINSPVTFLGREISLLNTKAVEVTSEAVDNLSPFQLSEANILNQTVDDIGDKAVDSTVTPASLDANKPVVLIYHSHSFH